MSYSSTQMVTKTSTFTSTHASYIAAKVATDLKRMQRFYGEPSDKSIDNYEAEVILLLKHGYLKKVSYGFLRNGSWTEPTLIYTSNELTGAANDDPGKIRPGQDIANAVFYSFLEYSDAWFRLSDKERELFEKNLPIQRGTGNTPGINGYLDNDRTYSSGGRALSRSSVRSFS